MGGNLFIKRGGKKRIRGSEGDHLHVDRRVNSAQSLRVAKRKGTNLIEAGKIR